MFTQTGRTRPALSALATAACAVSTTLLCTAPAAAATATAKTSAVPAAQRSPEPSGQPDLLVSHSAPPTQPPLSPLSPLSVLFSPSLCTAVPQTAPGLLACAWSNATSNATFDADRLDRLDRLCAQISAGLFSEDPVSLRLGSGLTADLGTRCFVLRPLARSFLLE